MATEFFRKNYVEYDTEISPQYPDAYLGNQTTIDVSGGNIIKKGIFEFKIADTPTFGTANLFRLKVGLHTNSITRGKEEPRMAAFLMKTNLSDNPTTFEEGSLYLRCEEFCAVGSKPSSGTFWEENFDTDKTINNPNATTVENMSGTVSRTADYGVFVEDLMKWIGSEDVTGGEGGSFWGITDFEEFSQDFDEFMDDATTKIDDKEGMRSWLIKNYAIKSAGFTGGEMQSGNVDTKGWWDNKAAGGGAISGGKAGGVTGLAAGTAMVAYVAPVVALAGPVGWAGAALAVAGIGAIGAAGGAIIGGVAKGGPMSWEENVISEWTGTPKGIDQSRTEWIIMLNKVKRSGRHDRYVPKHCRGAASEWWVHVVGYEDNGGLDESGYIITNPVILQDVEVESEEGLLGEVTPDNSMAKSVVTQEPRFSESSFEIDSAKLKSVGRVNFTKNNTLNGMNMIMKNVWNYSIDNTSDPTMNSPTLMGHSGPIANADSSSGPNHPESSLTDAPLGIGNRQETRVVYGKIPRPPSTNRSPGFLVGQNMTMLNAAMFSDSDNLMRNNANQWAFSNSQGVEIEFEVYFDTMSEGWCESTHPEDVGPGQKIQTANEAGTNGIYTPMRLGTNDVNNPPGSDKEANYWTTDSEITFLDVSTGDTATKQTIPVASSAAGVITTTGKTTLTVQDAADTQSDEMYVHLKNGRRDTAMILSRRGFHVTLGPNEPSDTQTFSDYMIHNLAKEKANYLLSFIRCGSSNVTPQRRNKINVLWQDNNWGEGDEIAKGAPTTGRMCWLPHKGEEGTTVKTSTSDDDVVSDTYYTDIRWANLHVDSPSAPSTGGGAYRNQTVTLDTGKWYRVRLFLKHGMGSIIGDITDVNTGNKITYNDGLTAIRDMHIGPGPGLNGGYKTGVSDDYVQHLGQVSSVGLSKLIEPGGTNDNDGTYGDKGYVKPPDINNIANDSCWPNYMTLWNCNHAWDTDKPDATKKALKDIWTGPAADAGNTQTKVQLDGIRIVGGNWDKDFATVDTNVSVTQRDSLNLVTTETIPTVGALTGLGQPDDATKGPLAVIANGWSGTSNHLDRHHDYHSITTTPIPYCVSLGYNEARFAPYMYDCTLGTGDNLWTIDGAPTSSTSLGFTDDSQGNDITDTPDFYKGATVINRTGGASPTGWYSAEITGSTAGVLTVTNIKTAAGAAGVRGSGGDIVTIVNEVYSLFNGYTTKDSSNNAKLTGDILGTFSVPNSSAANNNIFGGGYRTHWTPTNVNTSDGSTERPTGVVTGGTAGSQFGTNSTLFKMDGANPKVVGSIHNWSTQVAAAYDVTAGCSFYFWAKPNTANSSWAETFSTQAGGARVNGVNAETVLFRVKIGQDASNYWWRDFTVSNFRQDGTTAWTLCSMSLAAKEGGIHTNGDPSTTGIDWIEIDFNTDIEDDADQDNGIYFYGGYVEPLKLTDVMGTFSHNYSRLGAMKREDFITTLDKNFIAANDGIKTTHKVVGLTVGDASKEVAIDFGADTDDWTATTAPNNASVSGFTSKGFVRWRFDATGQTILTGGWGDDPTSAPDNDNVRENAGSGYPTFSKRENILNCARVLQVLDSKTDVMGRNVATTVVVDRPDVLTTSPTNTKFTIFQEGQVYGTTTDNVTAHRASQLDITSSDISGNQVTIRYEPDTDLTFLTDSNSNALFLGPQMYWTTLRIKPGASAASTNIPSRTYKSIACTSNPYEIPIDSNTNTKLKSSAGAKKVIGPTYNESYWANSEYANGWNMDLASSYPAFRTDKDWGFGAASDENPDLGYCAQSYIVQNGSDGQYNEVEVNSIFQMDNKKSGDIVSFLFAPLRESNSVEFNFDSAEGTNKPYMLTTFIDPRPTPPSLTLVLEEGNEDPTIMWQANDDDLWYGLLHLDTNVITSQYHNSVAYIPMDESHQDLPNKLYRFDLGIDKFYFKPETRVSTQGIIPVNDTSAVPVANIEGLAGHAAEFTQAASTLIQSQAYGNGTISAYTEPTDYKAFTFSTHIIPDSGTYTKRWIAHQRGKFSIWLDSNNKVNARVYYQKGTGTISNPNALKPDGTTTYYATHGGNFDDDAKEAWEVDDPRADTGNDVKVVTNAAHGLATGDMLHIANANVLDYNGYYPHVTVTNSTTLYCGPTRWDAATYDETTPVTWTGFNYIDLKGSSSIPSDGALPTHVLLLVDTEAHNANVKLYINGKVEDMTGKSLSLGDDNHWQSGATLMKSNAKLIIGNGEDVSFGVVQHASDDLPSTAGTISKIRINDSHNLNGGADDYWNNMQMIVADTQTDHTNKCVGYPVDSDYDSVSDSTVATFSITCNTNHVAGLSDGTTTSTKHVTHTADAAQLRVGMFVTGAGLPAGAYIVKRNTNICFTASVEADATVTGGSLAFTETIPAPWVELTSVGSYASNPVAHGGDKYAIISKYGFDGKIEETCVWNSIVFPVSSDMNALVESRFYHIQELPDDNTNAGSLVYNAKLFLKDYHNIRGAKPSRIATSNSLAWRKPSFSLDTN